MQLMKILMYFVEDIYIYIYYMYINLSLISISKVRRSFINDITWTMSKCSSMSREMKDLQ